MIKKHLSTLLIALLLISSPLVQAANKNTLDINNLSAADHFLYAISQNNIGLAQQLLQQGVDINYRSANRQLINTVNVRADRVNRFMGGSKRYQHASGTAYDIALSKANSQTVQWLLRNGANPAAGFFKPSVERMGYPRKLGHFF